MTDQTNTTTLSQTAASVKEDAAALGSKAADQLATAADARKDTVAQPLRQVSSAIDAAGEKLTGGDTPLPAWVNDSLRSVSTGISDFATRIEQSDSKQLLADVQDFARNKPTLFLAGCAALGFAAARVLRAGSAPSSSTQDDGSTNWHEGDVGGFGSSGATSTYGSSAPADRAASGFAGTTGTTGTMGTTGSGSTLGGDGLSGQGTAMGAGSGL